MKRTTAAVLIAGTVLGMTGCGDVSAFLDETVDDTGRGRYGSRSTARAVKGRIGNHRGFRMTRRTDPRGRAGRTKLIIATDLHYLASDLTDRGAGFVHSMEHGDGKVTNYIWEITDAFVAEVLNEKPDGVMSAVICLIMERGPATWNWQKNLLRLRTPESLCW